MVKPLFIITTGLRAPGAGPAGMKLAAGGGDVAAFAPADDDCVVAADQGFLKGQEPLLRGWLELGAFVRIERDQIDLGLDPLQPP